jgi:hypothetical protein
MTKIKEGRPEKVREVDERNMKERTKEGKIVYDSVQQGCDLNKDPTCEVLRTSCVTWIDSYRGRAHGVGW